ncbi:hypothetical protein, variant [Aphanomyces astaci]|uniref:Malonyl-CoA decarboxylase C-terminal domain-containing protein n=2 Tax=Aphanomyces astaci TaxID=112090 RepID=W4FMH8_APHAT|nr:hypothetical protein H257_15479 [Aphanomyces astaci]XP_009841901.1 hypothetical protein, variant [Aphanomyces astaci]ETV68675.1 hypothetical protein H257_15479 [Aphanomyces astaci]ETV68676.1 hypothetical protein, variant [Aphanomyces astaci]|eukprot:XP_009841900.1 hypothetical protein H257_15479 [Aphanomyces astaci]
MWRHACSFRAAVCVRPPLLNQARIFSSQTSPVPWDSWRAAILSTGESEFLKTFQLPRDRASLAHLMRTVATTKERNGDFVPRVIIKSIAASYKSLDFDSKQVFLLTLARDLHVDAPTVQQTLSSCAASISTVTQSDTVDWNHDQVDKYLRSIRALRDSLTPLYELLFRQLLSQLDGGMLFLVQLRADLRQVLGKISNSKDVVVLRALDQHLQSFLASWFSVGFLRLERVTYEQSPGALLEKIIRYEAVHPVGTIIELKRRLGRGRRCFAFFHPSVPDEPLVFVHVALVPRLADSMTYIKEATEQLADEHEANAAIFYSISSTQPGLQGVDLGNFLIKQVAKRLQEDLPNISVYSTLSPIPGFTAWLHLTGHSNLTDSDVAALKQLRGNDDQGFDANETLKRVLAIPDWHTTEHVVAVVQPILMRLGAHYLFREKKRGKALCPVANFHLRNGAIFERLNWLGDMSPKGLKNSAGLMVNYKYELSQVEANNENYLLHNTIPIGEQPLSILVD